MQQGKTLARIVCHYLPHLAEHPAHIHRCTNALYDSTLLSSVAEALSFPVGAAQTRADVTLVDGLDLHWNSLRLECRSRDATDPEL